MVAIYALQLRLVCLIAVVLFTKSQLQNGNENTVVSLAMAQHINKCFGFLGPCVFHVH